MKLCSACLQELDKEAFSAKQWKLNQHQRRCKNCVDGGRESQIERPDVAENGEYLPKFPLTDEAVKKAIKDLIDNAVKMIMKRGIPPNVGLDGFNEKKLAKRLWKVANNNVSIEFFRPFLLGLASGSRNHINRMASWLGHTMPILHWICQYRFFHAQFDYQGGDDMIALAISAGANVNAENPSNGATAIFFAVKYSSLRTVQMLLEQGATIDHRDNYGQTIWKNAVEFPDLEVIDFLLRRYADDIPVVRDRVKVRHQSTGKSYTFTLPDHMLGLYMGMLPTTDTPDMWMPVSWRVMGCPDNEILGTALLRVMQAGARLSGSSSASEESFSALGFDPLSIVTHIDDRRLEKSEMLEKRAPTGRILADVIFGRRLPAKIHAEILEKEHSPRILDPTCPICLTDMDERNQPITLYCGHRFCTVCIRSFGQATLSVEREMTDKRCPLCRRLLCGDLLSEDFKRKYRSGQIRFGVDRHREDELEDEFIIGDRGPHLLSDEQLQFECQRILGSSQRNRADMLRDLFAKMETASLDFSNGDTVNAQQKELKFELTATHSMAANEKFVILAPGIGPVFVPIQVKHVPLLAGLSPLSFFTVVPMSIVYSFRLKTKPIRSSRFINCFGNVVQVTAVIDDFKFCLGDIEICLNNAVVLSDNRIENIQLGMDFLESAAWVRCSTVVEAKEVKEAKALSTQYVVTDGGFSKDLFLSEQPDEIRYYSRDGRIAVLPFIHIKNLTMDASLPLVSLPDDILTTSFPECQWCCRCFPSDSLLHHNGRYYCDEECLTNGLKIRPD